MLPYLLWGWAFLAVGMLALWTVQLRTRNATSVDLAWAAGLDLLVVGYAATYPSYPARRSLVCLLGGLWAMRLAFHLYHDRVRGKPEDGRYRTLRDGWGPRAPFRFFLLYQGEALVAALFSVPLLAAMRGSGVDRWCLAGIALWAVAVGGETLADRQLARWRADPANHGKTCRTGLWRYSRHPNYFFEWLHWFTYVLIGRGAPLTWLGPALMLLFLIGLTGIPPAEAQALKSRGDDYRAYQRETSAFIPWPPRRPREA